MNIEEIKEKAEAGDAAAQYELGCLHHYGLDVPQNDQEAMKWLLEAADKGHSGAQYYLFTMYKNGIGVPKDKIRAKYWYDKSKMTILL